VLLARAFYASTATAGVGGTPGVGGDNTPQYDLELLYHDRRRMGRTSACPGQELRLPGSRVTASTEPPIGQPRSVRSACSAWSADQIVVGHLRTSAPGRRARTGKPTPVSSVWVEVVRAVRGARDGPLRCLSVSEIVNPVVIPPRFARR
jgi:hypothetical protein